MMTIPCEQEPVIRNQGEKIDQILANQEQSARDMKAAIDKLTTIIMTDIERRMEVDQLKKESELHFEKNRNLAEKVDAIEVRNAKCDGAGIFDNFPIIWNWFQAHKDSDIDFKKMWRWYLMEQGWRRFVPATMTVLTGLLALYIGMQSISNGTDDGQPHIHREDPIGSSVKDFGVPK
jgi:hypothetical protein